MAWIAKAQGPALSLRNQRLQVLGSDGDRIGVLPDANELKIGTIGEARERHFGCLIGMRAAVFGRNTGGRGESFAQFRKVPACEGDVGRSSFPG